MKQENRLKIDNGFNLFSEALFASQQEGDRELLKYVNDTLDELMKMSKMREKFIENKENENKLKGLKGTSKEV